MGDAAKRASRLLGTGSQLGISFEFFPPKTEAMEQKLWESIERLAPLSPTFRLGHLRGGRLDPRAHPCDGRPDPQGDGAQAGRASHLRCGHLQ